MSPYGVTRQQWVAKYRYRYRGNVAVYGFQQGRHMLLNDT